MVGKSELEASVLCACVQVCFCLCACVQVCFAPAAWGESQAALTEREGGLSLAETRRRGREGRSGGCAIAGLNCRVKRQS